MLFITFFLFLCSIISTFYYEAIDGIIAWDYSKIRLVPFLYLLLCFLITCFPIMKYDTNGCESIAVSVDQNKLLKLFIIFLIIISIEPFLENLMLAPSKITSEAAIDEMYEQRIYKEYEEPLSGLGRKLFRISTAFQFLYPVLLFYFISRQKRNLWIIAGILMMIVSFWLHELITGSRTGIVQDVLYLIACYFIMRRFIPSSLNKKIGFYGLIFLGLAVLVIMCVSMARYNSNDNMDEDFTLWLWLGLYAGEGNINFSAMMWDITRSTEGDSTMILLKSLLGMTDKTGVADNWEAVARLGIPGNIFYTYVGAIFTDFNKVGTIIFLVILAAIVYAFTKNKGRTISLVKIILIALCARIVVLPTFYTFATITAQINLVCTLGFCVIYSLWGRVYNGSKRIL